VLFVFGATKPQSPSHHPTKPPGASPRAEILMKHLAEYRDAEKARLLAAEIRRIVTRPWAIMEVCGGQTHSIIRNGIDELLPAEADRRVDMIHGPGCPVCVTPLETIDKALAIAADPRVIFCSFGDMLRVPGSRENLFAVKGAGGDVRVVYSPLDALALARQHPDREVVFLAIGFETTAPANAMAVKLAQAQGLRNFSLLVSHVLVPPAIQAIMRSPGNRVQAFLAAGHRWRRSAACRSWSPASSRSTCSRGFAARLCSSRRGGPKWRMPIRGW